jgi:hypothetical protein
MYEREPVLDQSYCDLLNPGDDCIIADSKVKLRATIMKAPDELNAKRKLMMRHE